MSTAQKQYLHARNEVQSSLNQSRNLRDQWLAAKRNDPNNLTKKEIDYIGKAFKNKVLTVKWDCEDLEELVNETETNNLTASEINEARTFVGECRSEIIQLMKDLDEDETNSRIFNKHGITLPNSNQINLGQLVHNSGKRYEGLLKNDPEEVQFDKSQLTSTPTIFNNALYDHIEEKGFNSSQVFNNLSRPETNVYMNPSENEIILDMLETEYYNPPTGIAGPRLNYTIRKFLERDRNRFLGTVAFLFSFPIILIILLVM